MIINADNWGEAAHDIFSAVMYSSRAISTNDHECVDANPRT